MANFPINLNFTAPGLDNLFSRLDGLRNVLKDLLSKEARINIQGELKGAAFSKLETLQSQGINVPVKLTGLSEAKTQLTELAKALFTAPGKFVTEGVEEKTKEKATGIKIPASIDETSLKNIKAQLDKLGNTKVELKEVSISPAAQQKLRESVKQSASTPIPVTRGGVAGGPGAVAEYEKFVGRGRGAGVGAGGAGAGEGEFYLSGGERYMRRYGSGLGEGYNWARNQIFQAQLASWSAMFLMQNPITQGVMSVGRRGMEFGRETVGTGDEMKRMQLQLFGSIRNRPQTQQLMNLARDIELTSVGTLKDIFGIMSNLAIQPTLKPTLAGGNQKDIRRIVQTTQMLGLLNPFGMEGAQFIMQEMMSGELYSVGRRLNVTPDLLLATSGVSRAKYQAASPLERAEMLGKYTRTVMGEDTLEEFNKTFKNTMENTKGYVEVFQNTIAQAKPTEGKSFLDTLTNSFIGLNQKLQYVQEVTVPGIKGPQGEPVTIAGAAGGAIGGVLTRFVETGENVVGRAFKNLGGERTLLETSRDAYKWVQGFGTGQNKDFNEKFATKLDEASQKLIEFRANPAQAWGKVGAALGITDDEKKLGTSVVNVIEEGLKTLLNQMSYWGVAAAKQLGSAFLSGMGSITGGLMKGVEHQLPGLGTLVSTAIPMLMTRSLGSQFGTEALFLNRGAVQEGAWSQQGLKGTRPLGTFPEQHGYHVMPAPLQYAGVAATAGARGYTPQTSTTGGGIVSSISQGALMMGGGGAFRPLSANDVKARGIGMGLMGLMLASNAGIADINIPNLVGAGAIGWGGMAGYNTLASGGSIGERIKAEQMHGFDLNRARYMTALPMGLMVGGYRASQEMQDSGNPALAGMRLLSSMGMINLLTTGPDALKRTSAMREAFSTRGMSDARMLERARKDMALQGSMTALSDEQRDLFARHGIAVTPIDAVEEHERTKKARSVIDEENARRNARKKPLMTTAEERVYLEQQGLPGWAGQKRTGFTVDSEKIEASQKRRAYVVDQTIPELRKAAEGGGLSRIAMAGQALSMSLTGHQSAAMLKFTTAIEMAGTAVTDFARRTMGASAATALGGAGRALGSAGSLLMGGVTKLLPWAMAASMVYDIGSTAYDWNKQRIATNETAEKGKKFAPLPELVRTIPEFPAPAEAIKGAFKKSQIYQYSQAQEDIATDLADYSKAFQTTLPKVQAGQITSPIESFYAGGGMNVAKNLFGGTGGFNRRMERQEQEISNYIKTAGGALDQRIPEYIGEYQKLIGTGGALAGVRGRMQSGNWEQVNEAGASTTKDDYAFKDMLENKILPSFQRVKRASEAFKTDKSETNLVELNAALQENASVLKEAGTLNVSKDFKDGFDKLKSLGESFAAGISTSDLNRVSQMIGSRLGQFTGYLQRVMGAFEQSYGPEATQAMSAGNFKDLEAGRRGFGGVVQSFGTYLQNWNEESSEIVKNGYQQIPKFRQEALKHLEKVGISETEVYPLFDVNTDKQTRTKLSLQYKTQLNKTRDELAERSENLNNQIRDLENAPGGRDEKTLTARRSEKESVDKRRGEVDAAISAFDKTNDYMTRFQDYLKTLPEQRVQTAASIVKGAPMQYIGATSGAIQAGMNVSGIAGMGMVGLSVLQQAQGVLAKRAEPSSQLIAAELGKQMIDLEQQRRLAPFTARNEITRREDIGYQTKYELENQYMGESMGRAKGMASFAPGMVYTEAREQLKTLEARRQDIIASGGNRRELIDVTKQMWEASVASGQHQQARVLHEDLKKLETADMGAKGKIVETAEQQMNSAVQNFEGGVTGFQEAVAQFATIINEFFGGGEAGKETTQPTPQKEQSAAEKAKTTAETPQAQATALTKELGDKLQANDKTGAMDVAKKIDSFLSENAAQKGRSYDLSEYRGGRGAAGTSAEGAGTSTEDTTKRPNSQTFAEYRKTQMSSIEAQTRVTAEELANQKSLQRDYSLDRLNSGHHFGEFGIKLGPEMDVFRKGRGYKTDESTTTPQTPEISVTGQEPVGYIQFKATPQRQIINETRELVKEAKRVISGGGIFEERQTPQAVAPEIRSAMQAQTIQAPTQDKIEAVISKQQAQSQSQVQETPLVQKKVPTEPYPGLSEMVETSLGVRSRGTTTPNLTDYLSSHLKEVYASGKGFEGTAEYIQSALGATTKKAPDLMDYISEGVSSKYSAVETIRKEGAAQLTKTFESAKRAFTTPYTEVPAEESLGYVGYDIFAKAQGAGAMAYDTLAVPAKTALKAGGEFLEGAATGLGKGIDKAFVAQDPNVVKAMKMALSPLSFEGAGEVVDDWKVGMASIGRSASNLWDSTVKGWEKRKAEISGVQTPQQKAALEGATEVDAMITESRKLLAQPYKRITKTDDEIVAETPFAPGVREPGSSQISLMRLAQAASYSYKDKAGIEQNSSFQSYIDENGKQVFTDKSFFVGSQKSLENTIRAEETGNWGVNRTMDRLMGMEITPDVMAQAEKQAVALREGQTISGVVGPQGITMETENRTQTNLVDLLGGGSAGGAGNIVDLTPVVNELINVRNAVGDVANKTQDVDRGLSIRDQAASATLTGLDEKE